MDHIQGSTLSEIVKDVYRKYPNLDKFVPQEYKKLFPKLSIEEISENREVILEYVEKLMSYDIVSAYSQLENAEYTLADFSSGRNNRSATISGFLNGACVVSIVIAHPRLDISGLQAAQDFALSESGAKGLPSCCGGNSDRMDALRHGIWAVYMGKLGTWRYSDPGNAGMIIAQIFTAHECAQSGLPSKMDMHNNYVSLNYYLSNVSITGSWPNRNTAVSKSIGQISNEIAAYSVTPVSTEFQMDSPSMSNRLVRLN